MSYLGRHARTSAERGAVWDILRSDRSESTHPFTSKEFYDKHSRELEAKLGPINPGASVKAIVKGSLQSLARKGLLQAKRGTGDTTYVTNSYLLEAEIARYTYGRALVEAQRLHLL